MNTLRCGITVLCLSDAASHTHTFWLPTKRFCLGCTASKALCQTTNDCNQIFLRKKGGCGRSECSRCAAHRSHPRRTPLEERRE